MDTVCILHFPKKGDLRIAKDYRGITPIHSGQDPLRNRIEPKIEKLLRKNHNDFRRNRSTTSQILTIRLILVGTIYQPLRSGRIWHKVNFFKRS